jgi:copper resistance protein B
MNVGAYCVVFTLAASFAQAQGQAEHERVGSSGHAMHGVPGSEAKSKARAGHHARKEHGGTEHAGMAPAVDHALMHDAPETAAARPVDARVPSAHVAPPPPQHEMAAMSAAEMIDVMGMDDRASYGLVAFDRFEAAHADAGTAFAWSAHIAYGGDADRAWLRSEGERLHGRTGHADIELLWGHAIAPYWDTQIGVRHDFGSGPDRNWAAFGVQGLAPYWFEVSATAYIGEQGRTALRGEVEYEGLLTQRLVLQPRAEINAYGKSDRAAGVGAGLSDAAFGLRLRYEIRREFAPYVGIERHWRFGGAADAARADGEMAAETQWVAGVRFWF